MTDPRLTAFLALAREREHPYYAAAAYTLARECGDSAAMNQALALGAAKYRHEPCVYATTEGDMLDHIITGDAKELAEQIPDKNTSSSDLANTRFCGVPDDMNDTTPQDFQGDCRNDRGSYDALQGASSSHSDYTTQSVSACDISFPGHMHHDDNSHSDPQDAPDYVSQALGCELSEPLISCGSEYRASTSDSESSPSNSRTSGRYRTSLAAPRHIADTNPLAESASAALQSPPKGHYIMTDRYRSMLDTIVTGDARELAEHLPPASIDLIFCDPIYQNTDDYRWLAKTALRVLKPKGAVLAWCSKPKLARSQIAMEDVGLEYVYTLDYTVTAKTYRMRWYNLFCWTTPCLWMQRDGSASRPRRWIPDTYTDTIVLDGESVELRTMLGDTFVSTGGPSGGYIWNKNLGVLKAWIDAFSAPDATVYDPFTGSGSVPVVCKLLGRHFYASEIKPDVATEARARIDDTPLPMAGMLSECAEQVGMELV